ncbi:ANGPT4 [Branchiostoma lanceolatum]|uniref:ANGPT4 protein n=1 Tax=Branchiostoma lanceolatum TaxID=7740 RepID=A0A8J9ZLR8_BRALA|nr:ANGPT4 [Branchiostoma lanceolatum]
MGRPDLRHAPRAGDHQNRLDSLHREFDGIVSFERPWRDYRDGFGDPQGEFWLGLEVIHQLVSQETHDLRIELGDWEGREAHAQYSRFNVSDEADGYRLNFGDYTGTAGDGLGAYQKYSNAESPETPLDYHKGRAFKVSKERQGWWYGDFTLSNLNGPYINSSVSADVHSTIYWIPWSRYSLKSSRMMVRPASFVSGRG